MRPLLLCLLLTACGGSRAAVLEVTEMPDAAGDAPMTPEAAPPDADVADRVHSDVSPIADTGVDAPSPDASTDAGAGEAAPEDAADEPDAAPPTYVADCQPWTPWQTVCSLSDGGACSGHTWVCSTDGGVLADEFAPNVGTPLSYCADMGASNTHGEFCCCQ